MQTTLCDENNTSSSSSSEFSYSCGSAFSTPVHSVTSGPPCRSLWPQLWAHLWCNIDWTTSTPLCMECQHLTCTNYSLPRILLLVWFCLLFAIFQQVSDLVTSTGFLSTAECSSKSPHSPIRPWQPVSHLTSTIFSNYTSHHELSVLQPSNYSKYHMSTDFGRRAFSYSFPATWNSIPISIKNCSSLYSFKRHLKSHLIAQLINN